MKNEFSLENDIKIVKRVLLTMCSFVFFEKLLFCLFDCIEKNTGPGFVQMDVEISFMESAGMDFPLSPSWQI